MSLTLLTVGTRYQAPIATLSGPVARPAIVARNDVGYRIPILVAPAGARPSEMARFAACLALHADPVGFSPALRESWLFSVAEAILPGLAQKWLPANFQLDAMPMDAADWAQCNAAGATTPAGAPSLRQIHSPEAFCEVAVPAAYAVAALAALLFAVVKAPNNQSAAHYVVKRATAAQAAAGMPYMAEYSPVREYYDVVSSVVGANAAIRESIADWAIDAMLQGPADPVTGILVSQTRLWRGAGSAGLHMVAKMVARYSLAIETVHAIQDELEAFHEHLTVYTACTDPKKEYFLAKYGPRNPVSARRSYAGLVAMARHFDTSGAASMANFAATRSVPGLAEVVANAVRLGLTMTPRA